VDGYFMTASVRETVARGQQNDVPVLTGVNLGEIGGSMMGPGGPVSLESYRNTTRERYGDLADEFLRLYPATTDEEATAAQTQRSRDTSLVSMYLWSRERARNSETPSYLYLWDHTLPGPDAARYGAFHTSEVPYVMNTLYMSDRPFTDVDHKIADMLSSYWTNFVATGDPNGEGLPVWSPAGDKPELMEVGDKNQMVPPAGSTAKYELIEEFLTR
jgi:carboxylesterase type B